MAPSLTAGELEFLRGQRLGRLATVDGAGGPQNNPVGFFIDEATGQILIGGFAMGKTRKFRNVRSHPNVALVVDELASTDPWVVRGVEIRGTAEALTDVDPPLKMMSREVIRITPRWIGSWGIVSGQREMDVRR
ncbi:MAG TPA: PPOX class F420-dependent oxidoreductase [Acidimicrobiales bacterium]